MSLPGMNPPIAALALSSLLTSWNDLIQEQGRGIITEQDPNACLLAAILLSHESPDLVKGTCLTEIDECIELANEDLWALVEIVPWALLKGYLVNGAPDPNTLEKLERGLGQDKSTVRQWFHYVAWMIRDQLDADRVRPVLLGNLADKLAAVEESAGLLAGIHSDKDELDRLADTFVPPKGFEAQYRSRIDQTREAEWNHFTQHYWIVENKCRKLIWDTVKSVELHDPPNRI